MNYEKIKAKLDAGICLHAVFESIDSTNTYLKKLCTETDVIRPTAVVAAQQSGGRGRLGRSFVSPNGGIYLSLAFPVRYSADDMLLITAAAAVAVCRVLDSYTNEPAQIKWVNDVYLGGKKVCGILTEAVTDARRGCIKNTVVGIGLNLCGYEAFPAELKEIITTLKQHATALPAREALVAQIVNELSRMENNLTDEAIMEEYRQRSFVIGKPVRVIQNDRETNAVVTDIDARGGLCVTYENGETAVLQSAEISIRTI